MTSPFTAAEQKRLYPNRKDCRNANEVKDHIKTLIDKGVITLEKLEQTSFGDLKYSFFLNVNA